MKVLAVIVTYNRLQLLKECVSALDAQVYSNFDIIIVNNNSTDGTAEWLDLNFTSANRTHIDQENVGGSGGFHTGINHAILGGYKWAWVMDDDGYPDKLALDRLMLKASDSYGALCCTVLSKENPHRLAFSLPILRSDNPVFFGRNKCIINHSDLVKKSNDNLYPLGNFFNGVLLNLDVVKDSGNVNKNMFISGDEVDMMFRVNKIKPVYTVVDSLHYHPESTFRLMPEWREYYRLRNAIYNIIKHYNFKTFRIINQLIVSRSLLYKTSGIKLYFKAIYFGINGDVSSKKASFHE